MIFKQKYENIQRVISCRVKFIRYSKLRRFQRGKNTKKHFSSIHKQSFHIIMLWKLAMLWIMNSFSDTHFMHNAHFPIYVCLMSFVQTIDPYRNSLKWKFFEFRLSKDHISLQQTKMIAFWWFLFMAISLLSQYSILYKFSLSSYNTKKTTTTKRHEKKVFFSRRRDFHIQISFTQVMRVPKKMYKNECFKVFFWGWNESKERYRARQGWWFVLKLEVKT